MDGDQSTKKYLLKLERNVKEYKREVNSLIVSLNSKDKTINRLNQQITQLDNLLIQKEEELGRFIAKFFKNKDNYEKEMNSNKTIIQALKRENDELKRQGYMRGRVERQEKSLIDPEVHHKDQIIFQLQHALSEANKKMYKDSEIHKNTLNSLRSNKERIESLEQENISLINKLRSHSTDKQFNGYFKGEWIDGKKNGYCIVKDSKHSMKGLFVDDKLDGEGTLIDIAEDREMTGLFKKGLYQGTTMRIGKTKYKGGISNNKPHGKGYLVFLNDFTFEGSFNQGDIDNNHKGVVVNIKTGKEVLITCFNNKKLTTDSGQQFSMNFETGEMEQENEGN